MRELGAVYGPYTGTCFASARETDIEHIVAASEAHDSGLCAADAAIKARFARDLRNLTLASPRLNRHEKSGHDAAEWAPARNRCWFAARVVEVRQATGLPSTGARRRRSIAFSVGARAQRSSPSCAPRRQALRAPPAGSPVTMRSRYDDNRNGAITCAEARPVPRSHPAYRFMRDGDEDGVVCE